MLTDISELNVDEYQVMWRALHSRARGSAVFSLQDVRSLHFDAAAFDVVYSMSVIEHVEGESGDSTAMREMVRVLKPGGLLVVSVPFGRTYAEQHRVGFAGAARKTGDHGTYFFSASTIARRRTPHIEPGERSRRRRADDRHAPEPLDLAGLRNARRKRARRARVPQSSAVGRPESNAGRRHRCFSSPVRAHAHRAGRVRRSHPRRSKTVT